MAQSHVLSALIAKHSEIMGIIEYKQKELNLLKEKLNHIAESIPLFDESFDIDSISSKKYVKRNKYFDLGESTRLILELLRDSDNGYKSHEIASHLIKLKSLQNEDRKKLRRSIYGSLNHLKNSGKVVQEDSFYKISN